MSRCGTSIPPAYFDGLYDADPDPWCFAESPYERDKYAATLTALRSPVYRAGLEIGCSIGVLTRQLAPRCLSLLAVDVAEAALSQARVRCADHQHVAFQRRLVPNDWPPGSYDLIVLSEVVYYLDAGDVARLATRVMETAAPDADLVLVHWLGETNYPLSGDEAADLFIRSVAGAAVPVHQGRTADYRLDLLRVGPSREP